MKTGSGCKARLPVSPHPGEEMGPGRQPYGGVGCARAIGRRRSLQPAVRALVEDVRMSEPVPRIVHLTDHALAKSQILGIARSELDAAVLEGHRERTRNSGSADWLITVGGLSVAYNHPSERDQLTALIVTLWRSA